MVETKIAPPMTPEEVKKEVEKVEEEIEKKQEANKNDPQARFYVYLWDPRSSISKMKNFVTIGSVENVKDASLKDIRTKLVSEKALNWREKSSVFCNSVGAEVVDSLRFDMYLDYLKSTESEGEDQVTETEEKEKGKEKDKEKEKEKPKPKKSKIQQPVTNEDANGKSYKVYLKLRTIGMDESTKDFLKEKLDLELSRAENLDAKTNILTSSYLHKEYMALAGSGKNTHPADMGEREWYIVLQNNSVLHGNYVRELSSGLRKVERAMYPALTLKPRQFHDFETALDSKNSSSANTDENEDTMHYLRIPRFLVQDDSYVSVSENKSSVADAIADSSLSENAAEISAGGGAFGVSAGAKVGFKQESSTKTATNTESEKKRMTITYNFPRVVLELDGESLELSDECKKDLALVTTKEHVRFFKRKYGTFFATRVELGGRLHSSQESEAFAEATVGERAKSLKVSAAASFSSAWAQGSASFSHGDSDNHTEKHQNSTMNNTMTWEAKGGDTLLCNNPPAWCNTVASHYNWRVVKQEDLLSIVDMITLVTGNESTKKLFLSLDPADEDKDEITINPLPKIYEGWQTFWLKAANENTYPTVVQPSDKEKAIIDIINRAGMSPIESIISRNTTVIRYIHPSLQMRPSIEDNSQYFQAGDKFYEIWNDKKELKYRVRAGLSTSIRIRDTNSYLGATSLYAGVQAKSYIWADATLEQSCSFQFIHAFPSDKVYIDEDDLVRVMIVDAAGKPIGYLRNMPPLGSYGQSGDIFHFRYLGQ